MRQRHQSRMRPILITAVTLLLAACATAPKSPQPAQTLPASSHTRGEIIGRTADDLVRRFGTPALQIREGESLKLQFRSASCVLDAYLYPAGNTPHRVTYVDTRTPALADMDQTLCIDSLDSP